MSTSGLKRPRDEGSASTSSSTMQSFDLGELGMVQADSDPRAAIEFPLARGLPIGGVIHLPNKLWSGWSTGTSLCRIEGFTKTLPSGGKKRKPGAPTFIVRTLEDSHCYPFVPSVLAKAVKEGEEIRRADLQANPEWASLPSSSHALAAEDDSLPILEAVEVDQDALQWLTDADVPELPYVPEEVD